MSAITEHPLDVARLRQDFPMLGTTVNGQPLLYFDNAATTHKPQVVIDRLYRFYTQELRQERRGSHAQSGRHSRAAAGWVRQQPDGVVLRLDRQAPPNKYQAGTPAIGDIIALGTAVEYLQGIGMERIKEYEESLDRMMGERLERVPGVRVLGQAQEKVCLTSFVVEGLDDPSQLTQFWTVSTGRP